MKISTLKIVLICFILGMGLFLRSFHLGDQSLWIDEGYSINGAQAVLKRGLPVLDSGEWYRNGMASTYTIALSMKVFGFDPESPWSARLPSVLFGSASILMIFFLVRKVFKDDIIAICSSVLLAFSTWEVVWSMQARGYAGMQFFLLLSLYFFYQWYERRKYGDIFIGLASLLASILFHSSALAILPPAVFVLPFTSHFSHLPIVFLISGFPILLFSAFGAVLLQFFYKEKRKEIFSIAFLIIVPIIIFSTYGISTQARYLLVIFPLLLMLASYCIVSVVKLFKIKKYFVESALAIIISIVLMFPYLTFFSSGDLALEKGSPQPNFREAYKKIGVLKRDNDVILSPYAHLTKIYTGEVGYYLAMSLTGNKIENEKNKKRGMDYYTGGEMVDSIDEIREFMTGNTGFVVIDALSQVRLGREKLELIRSLGKEVYRSGRLEDLISVYEF